MNKRVTLCNPRYLQEPLCNGHCCHFPTLHSHHQDLGRFGHRALTVASPGLNQIFVPSGYGAPLKDGHLPQTTFPWTDKLWLPIPVCFGVGFQGNPRDLSGFPIFTPTQLLGFTSFQTPGYFPSVLPSFR